MKVKLGELINVKTGKLDANAANENGLYPFFTCSKEPLRINTYTYDCECVLVAGNGDLNVKYYKGKFDAYQRTYILESSSNKLYMPYLYFFMDKYVDTLRKQSIGGVIKYIKLENITNASLELIDINKQKEICNKIYKVKELIDKQKKIIDHLDTLIKARFVEMFGMCKRTVLVKDCCTYHSRIGWQALTTKEHQSTGEYLLITGTDFIDNRINYNACVYVSKERYDMDIKLQIKNGDILITKDGTIGKVAVVDNLPMCATLNAGIFVVRPDKRFFKEYIEYVFKGDLFQQFIEKSKTGATIKHLNQNKLENFEIVFPEISKQKEFAEFYNHIDKLKFGVQKSLEKTQMLFDSLMQEFFSK